MSQQAVSEFELRSVVGKEITRITVSWLLVSMLIFPAAGRLDWTMGWVFVGLWLVPKLAYVLLLARRDPALLAERATRHKDTKRWDKVLIPIYLLLALLTLFVAGLDGGRFRWSGSVPGVAVGFGIAAYLLSIYISGWVVLANPYSSSEARIQSERGQQVISSGPYRFVRHPMYLAAILIWPMTPLILESWWGVIPGVLTALTMVVRTALEDRMLFDELPGYASYAQQTRYRLIPGVW